MVDFTTQSRLQGYYYNAPTRTYSLHSFKEQYRRNEPLSFRTPRVSAHDCRSANVKEYTDPKFWETMLFSDGVNKTYQSVDKLHVKEVVSDPLLRPPEKLLYTTGKRGSGKEQFSFPRGVATDSEGDILVADTKNHRIQRYNATGIYKDNFGSKGEFRGEMINPTDVAVLENDDIVVADSGNNRVQIFRPQGRLKHIFNTKAKVIYVAVDQQSNVYCSTTDSTIEIYDRNRQLTGEFTVGQGQTAFPIAVTDNEEIIVCDTQANIVKIYSNDGKMFHQFTPSSEDDSLGMQMTAIAVDPAGQILIADGLNHVVNLYSSHGTLVSQVLRPTDDLGCIQALSVGPEGHILVTEYTTNGPHCLKVFRYGSCICHRSRGGSSKRTTPSSAKS